MPSFVDSNQDRRFLLSPDMRGWLPDDDLAHFAPRAVDLASMSHFKVNARGTGSTQYNSKAMLSLMIYSYGTSDQVQPESVSIP